MAHRSAFQTLASAALAAVLLTGCGGSSDPLPAPKPLGDVFIDDFGDGVSFQAFAGVPATGTGIAIDTSEHYAGAASLRVNVPEGGWNGGAFPSETPRDLTSFNALTFRVKASRAVTLDVVGFGNDNTGTSLYEASRKAVPVTTEWNEVVIPIPLPAKLAAERGLFYFAEAEEGPSFSLWFDDVRFVTLPAERLGAARPSIGDRTFTLEVGATKAIDATTVTFAVDGVDVVVHTQSSWFTYQSSNAAVASVDAKGVVAAKTPGTATVTAKLGEIEAAGAVSVVVGAANVPTTSAPAPTEDPADVIALYSGAYDNHPITTLGTDWSNNGAGPRLSRYTVGGDETLKFEDLLFAGIEFTGDALVDATEMTHFHVDVWTHDAAVFKVKLVDFGANGVYDGPGVADDTEQEWTFTATSTPALTHDGWVSIDIPITTLPARAHLAQLILSSDESTVFVDNLYFFAGEVVEPPPPTDEFPVVFGDGYATGVTFAPFDGSNNVMTIDTAEKHDGEASLRIAVPVGGYTGGAFVAAAPKDLSGYNAVTFWAKASRDAVLDKVGIANDATADVPFFAERVNLPLTTTWQKFVMPIPLPSKLVAERGLFHFAEGDATEYTIWIDDVRYETLDSTVLGAASAAIATEDVPLTVGRKRLVNGMVVNVPVDGSNVSVTPLSREWFTWASSNETVATVDARGEITAKAEGEANITAKLGAIDAGGVTKVIVSAPPAVTTPESPATAPTHAPADVISLFSDAYPNVAVGTWSASWDDTADPVDVEIGGDTVKKYENLVFAGIEGFSIDASAMTHFHVDVWSPDTTQLKIKLVDFGADGTYGGGDDTEHELTFTPANGEWVSLDVPLADFANMTGRAHVSQLIFVATNATVFFDNIYFHK